MPVELTYDPLSSLAAGDAPPVDGPIEYFAQAVDSRGNVALALDHGQPFTKVEAGVAPAEVYLPVVFKSYVHGQPTLAHHLYLPVIMH